MEKIFAKEITLPPIEGPGPFGKADPQKAGTNFAKIVSNILSFIIILAGLWAFIQFIIGGFTWITSAGDKAAVEAARNRIMYGVIGLLTVLAALGLIMLFEKMLGVCFGFSCPVEFGTLRP